MKRAVMCVQRSMLPPALRYAGTMIHKLNIVQDLPYEAIQFMNRHVVDAKQSTNTTLYSIGVMFPQLLPYTVIMHQDEVLVYDRKGAEGRLHGLSSIGIGGHVDIEDVALEPSENNGVLMDVQETLCMAARRELIEEAGISLIPKMDHAIISVDDEVGQVHIGLLSVIQLKYYGMSKSEVVPAEELLNARWVPLSELAKQTEQLENWSKLTLGWLLNEPVL